MNAALSQEQGVRDEFDAIVIGSSPLLLIEALYLERTGRRVAVVERKARLGGAWYTMPLFGYESVEPGCHYIERGRKGYEFLSRYLQIELEPRSVKAVWINTEQAPDDESAVHRAARFALEKILWGRFLSDDVWGVIKSIDRRDPFKFGRAIRRMIVSPRYLYPVGGSRTLVDALMRRVAASSIELFAESLVEGVVPGGPRRPNRCRIDGREYLASTLVVGQHAYPRLLTNDGEPGAADRPCTVNVLLRIEGRKAVGFDYLEIHRNDVVNRISDVTPFAHPRPAAESELLICCNLTNEHPRSAAIDTWSVFTHLLQLGLLRQDARLVDAHVEHYPSPETREGESTDSLRIVRTYDLGVALERNAERWRALLTA